ncbi:MAG: hypothetical protein QOJ73_2742 [Streptosporangiaceae bacterium]|jgi:hypothetical protein|nr:hypothetical protein [Streptosporangiaceae bacterium]
MIPASRPGRSRFGSPLILAAVTVTALAAGAGVAALATGGSPSLASSSGQLAATPSPSPSPSQSGYGTPGPGHRFFGGFGGGFGAGVAGALHGQFVVPRSGGGYQTEDTQRGSVTAVSTSSITVKSADGFTKTYQVTSSTVVDARRDGIGSVKNGHQVSVLATVSGGHATATNIQDLSLLRAGNPGPGGYGPGSTSG